VADRVGGAGVGIAARAASFRLLRAISNAALRARLITWVPTAGLAGPKDTTKEQRFLGAGDVAWLAEASPDRYHALVYLLAYGGLRIGEATALRVSDLNMLRGRLTISRSASLVNGRLIEGPTKTKKDRSVTPPLPPRHAG
jgi:integrase